MRFVFWLLSIIGFSSFMIFCVCFAFVKFVYGQILALLGFRFEGLNLLANFGFWAVVLDTGEV